jgi:hypothetical protein
MSNSTDNAILVRCEIELDIFSGMPNPTWTLTDAEAVTFVERLAALRRAAASHLSGNLGYRGFIVQCTARADSQLIQVQTGKVHITEGSTKAYADDEDRQLERWLLSTGRQYLKPEIYQIAERALTG